MPATRMSQGARPARRAGWPAPASRPTRSPSSAPSGAVAGALVFFTQGWWFAGTMLIWAFVMLDMVDGAVARAGGWRPTFGAVLDSTCDRIADAAVFGAIAWYFALHDQPWMLLAAPAVPGARLAHVLHPGPRRGGRADRHGRHRRAGRAADHRAGRHRAVRRAPATCRTSRRSPLWLLVAASTITVAPAIRDGVAAVQALSRARTRRP